MAGERRRINRIKRLYKKSDEALKEIVVREYFRLAVAQGKTVTVLRDWEEYKKRWEANEVHSKGKFVIYRNEEDVVEINSMLIKMFDSCMAARILYIKREYGLSLLDSPFATSEPIFNNQ